MLSYIAALPEAARLFIVGVGFVFIALLLRRKFSAVEASTVEEEFPPRGVLDLSRAGKPGAHED